MGEEDLLEVEAGAGRFRSDDRAIVTEQALPLLATYFADAPSWALASRAQLAKVDPETDELATFLRMRVALAAMDRLEPILRGILQRASFFYAREAEESVGALRGTLDLQRFVQTRLRPESPRRYPVRVLRRRYATPENAAACYAALWMARELADAPLHALPKGAPEYRQVLDHRSLLAQWLRQPALAQAEPDARHTRRQRDLLALLDAVRVRIDGGRIAGPDRYQRLVAWLESVEGLRVGAAAGTVEWSFYDERFDTKLFEIWSLFHLIRALERELGPPTQAVTSLLERGRDAIRSWQFGAVRVHLYFQPSLSRIAEGPVRWNFVAPTKEALTGFPDIALRITPVGRPPFAILLDPKLRQRHAAPADELYKVLGYFGNLPPQPVRGGIIFYSPGNSRLYRLKAGPNEQLLAVGTDPHDDSGTEAGFRVLAEMVRDAAAVDPEVIRLLEASAGEGDDAKEATTAIRQRAAVDAMSAAAAAMPEASLAPVRKSTSATLSSIWDRLSPATTTMLVTAEYFGTTAPNDADHSGPLLGLAAACERVLFENVFDDVMQARPDLFGTGATLGTLIHWLTDATRRRPRDPEGSYLARHLGSRPAIVTSALEHLTGELRRLNVDYRIPAAHRDVVTQALWSSGRSLILDPTSGILSRLVKATTVAPA